MIYNALIIDDERLARVKIHRMLEDFSEIQVLGEAGSVDEAIMKIQTLKPDILFLDIQMPGASGFELLDKIEFKGQIIFVTAYDEYAIRAFEVNAVDYLLKPLTHERLRKAIDKLSSKSELIIKSNTYTLKYDDLLFISVGSGVKFLKINSIVCIRSAIDYTDIYLNNGTNGLVLKPMREWEERLPETHFFRIHRSTIINIDFIEKVEKWFNQSYHVYIKGIDEPFTLSKRFAKLLKEKLS